MKLSIIYNVFVRDFRKQKKRITLTLVALGWGTISIMLLLGFGEGLHRQLTLNNKGMGSGIVVVWGGQTSIPYKGMGKGRRIWFHEEDVEYLKKRMPELKHIGAEYDRWGVKLDYNNNISTEHVTGITPNYEEMRYHYAEMGGRMINDADIAQKRRVAFIGNELKRRVFGEEDATGKQILINSMPFTVIGVMKPKLQTNSYSGSDEDKISIPLTTFQAIFGDRYLDNLVYQPYEYDDMKGLERKMYEIFAAKYKFDPKDDRALSVWDTVEGSREFNNIMIGIKVFLGVIGGLTLLIAGVGVANIMYVSVKERTREIGIKMAMGARKSYIMTQFLIEALMITFFGGFGGMSVSYVLTESFKRIPIESDVLDFMGRPTISLEVGVIVILILGIMGVLSGIFPAMRAASVSPVESLRYE